METTTRATPVLEPFVEQRTVLLTSFRRDGTPVGTPVTIAVEGDRAFIRSFDAAWKVKRMARNPEVRGRAPGRSEASRRVRRSARRLDCWTARRPSTPPS